MKDNWEVLKEYIEKMILDSNKYGNRFSNPYRNVYKLMQLIERGMDNGVYADNCIWKRLLMNGDSINILGEIIFYKHGSENSVDNDVIYVFDELPDKEACRWFCAANKSENRNIITIKDGVVDKCFKGTPDEINNALLVTYSLHDQVYPMLINRKVDRNKTIKAIRAVRIILSHISRSQYREEVKDALKSGWGEKIKCLCDVDLTAIDYSTLNKKMSREDVLKTIAFQLGQTYALLVLNKEVYTKSGVAAVCPELEPFIMREPDSDLKVLEDFKRHFLCALAEQQWEWDDNKMTLSDHKNTYDVINECNV